MDVKIQIQTRMTETMLVPLSAQDLYELARSKVSPERMPMFRESPMKFVICDPQGYVYDISTEIYLESGNHVLCVQCVLHTERTEILDA